MVISSSLLLSLILLVKPENLSIQLLQNPQQSNRQQALQCRHGLLRWYCAKQEWVTAEGMIPIVDYWRVYVNGKLVGKTKTMSYALKKGR